MTKPQDGLDVAQRMAAIEAAMRDQAQKLDLRRASAGITLAQGTLAEPPAAPADLDTKIRSALDERSMSPGRPYETASLIWTMLPTGSYA